MFTGIIEAIGTITSIKSTGTNISFWVSSLISTELKIDQSISHEGVCLTVEEINGTQYMVTAIDETLNKTTLKQWKVGEDVNLERCMQMNGRLDGHIVQGHVDSTAVCISAVAKDGSWEYSFLIDRAFASLIIEKGSISINGTSLTIFNVTETEFTVAIIPYTHTHTTIKKLKVGDMVNIEFDLIGKYVNRINQLS